MKKIIAIAGFLGLFAGNALITSAAYFNPAPIFRCESQITGTLQKGMESGEVGLLQQLLVNAGYLNAAPNGYFGNQTYQAVRAFQANNGITPTGMVGEATRNAINERLCDADLLDNTISYNSYGGYGYDSTGITYVTPEDPFVRVITPPVSTPQVFATPQVVNPIVISPVTTSATPIAPAIITPATSQIASTNIIYNPSVGYTYGIVPQSGSVTVSSPVANATYNEGDTVLVNWATSNITASGFTILLESTISGQSKVVGTATGNSYSFSLTKELLDSVCAGSCYYNNQRSSFRIVVSTPTTDIAGITSTLRAAVQPITINRPLPSQQVSLTASKTPVNSGEAFRLYVNVPQANQFTGYQYGSYTFKIRAVCPAGVSVSIAGIACGQEFTMPVVSNNTQQEVPVMITNTSFYKQDVSFVLTATNANGQVIGTGETRVTVNAQPFNW